MELSSELGASCCFTFDDGGGLHAKQIKAQLMIGGRAEDCS